MQLGAVCDRTLDGEEIEFGTSGYTMDNTFVLYDRRTDSVWYPLTEGSFDAVAGPVKGESLEFIAKPEVMRLHEWAAKHPDTLVLLPPPPTPEQEQARERRRRLIDRLTGTWAMTTEIDGEAIDATMTIRHDDETGLSGDWSSMGRKSTLDEFRFNGHDLRFTRPFRDGLTLRFEGEVFRDGEIRGVWKTDDGDLTCTGRKVTGEAPGGGTPDGESPQSPPASQPAPRPGR